MVSHSHLYLFIHSFQIGFGSFKVVLPFLQIIPKKLLQLSEVWLETIQVMIDLMCQYAIAILIVVDIR